MYFNYLSKATIIKFIKKCKYLIGLCNSYDIFGILCRLKEICEVDETHTVSRRVLILGI